MAKYKVTADDRSRMHNRDAYAVTVRVERDGLNLGLWQVWISGMSDMEIGRHRPSITDNQRRRIAAELLAEFIQEEASEGRLRSEWQIDATVVEPPPSAQEIISFATKAGRPVVDFRVDDTIREFDV